MKVNAYAKINMCLNVVGKRKDGYHELEMIMVPIDLHDVLTITFAQEDIYTSNDTSIPMDASNTVVKAVELMRSHFSLDKHFQIHVEKNIPAQAGLAGGSADGAAVLRVIKELCNLTISIEELSLLGKQIGADVPFCVMQCCSIVKGIGEKIVPFTNHCDFDILLVKPLEGVSTGKAFSLLDFSKCDHPDCEQVKKYMIEDDFNSLCNSVSNSLEYSAFHMVPEIKNIKEELQALGFPLVLMSGSGSCVFACTKDKILLNDTEKVMKEKGYFVCKTCIINSI